MRPIGDLVCGISGIFGNNSPEAIDEMVRCLAHRGPDGKGHFVENLASGTISLGHSRLAIRDISGSSQPIISEKGRVLIQNGEIYNSDKLRESITGYNWTTSGDSEAILALHEMQMGNFPKHIAPVSGKSLGHIRISNSASENGNPAEKHISWVSRLDGIWGFALWDPSIQELILCRDPLGVKPLIRHVLQEGTLIFGSEIKAFHGHPEFTPIPDLGALALRLAYEYPLDRSTLFSGVTNVGQGTIETWGLDEGGNAVLTGITTYCSSAFQPSNSPHDPNQSGLLLESLREGVADRMESEAPLGLVLSGGLDSSLIAALAKEHSEEHSNENPECWTVGGSEDNPDLQAAQLVAKSLDLSLNSKIISEDDMWKGLPRFVWNGEDLDLTVFFWQPLFEKMSKDVKVGICGQGADELHGGYSRYRNLAKHSEIIQNRMEQYDGWSQFQPFCGPAHNWIDDNFSPKQHFSDLPKTLQFELDRGQLTNFQLRLADRHGMATGLESRVPFLSKSHREASFSISMDGRINGDFEKIALREAASKTKLPEKIVSRPKMPAGTLTTPDHIQSLIDELTPHAMEWVDDYGKLAPLLNKQPDMAIGIRLFHSLHFTDSRYNNSSGDIFSLVEDVGHWP